MILPDGPRVVPYLHSITWWGRSLDFFDHCAQRYGGIFTLQVVGSHSFVVVSDPQAIKKIFTAPVGTFESGRANQFLRPFLGNNSLLLLDGNKHQQQRRLLMPFFHSNCLQNSALLIRSITQQQLTRLPLQEPFFIRQFLQSITIRVILQVVFGFKQEQQVELFTKYLNSTIDSFISFLPWKRSRFSHKKQQLDEIIYAEIFKHRQNERECETDILSLLLTTCDENNQKMTDVEIRDELMTVIVAGYESTTAAVAWSLYWAMKLPEVYEKLLHELSSLSANSTVYEITQLPYLSAVCAEALRIYSITGFIFDRIVKEPFTLMDYQFNPGTLLSTCAYLTHQRQEIYPEPKQFKPERFLERQFSQYEYLPFGGGSRRCIGMAFAQFEIKLVLATILMSPLRLSLVDHRLVRPVYRGVTLSPPTNLRAVAIPQ